MKFVTQKEDFFGTCNLVLLIFEILILVSHH